MLPTFFKVHSALVLPNEKRPFSWRTAFFLMMLSKGQNHPPCSGGVIITTTIMTRIEMILTRLLGINFAFWKHNKGEGNFTNLQEKILISFSCRKKEIRISQFSPSQISCSKEHYWSSLMPRRRPAKVCRMLLSSWVNSFSLINGISVTPSLKLLG